MNAFKIVFDVTNRLKPFLVKIIPISFLQNAKKCCLEWKTGRLKKEKIVPFKQNYYEAGINLIGNIRGDFGLGQSCRLVAREIQGSGIPFGICEYHTSDKDHMEDHSCDSLLLPEPKYNMNLFHINANEFTLAYFRLGKQVWDYRYNIAFWLWELEDFPKEWAGCIDLLHEVWTPSEFVSRAIRKRTDKPVVTIPYYVETPIDARYDRSYFSLPEDQFLFLMMYDSNSIMERKNPVGVLEAFQKAFTNKSQKAGLVIKLNGENKEEMDFIRQYLDGCENVYFMTTVLSKTEVNSLIAVVDVYVSMHRAEGFGLVLAEAMRSGTPCIATNWSANTEFMDKESACLLDYELVPIQKHLGPFRKGSCWAQPNVHQAARYMQRLYEDKEFYERISQNARRHAEKEFSLERSAELVRKRVREIYQLCCKE
ncbi:MAG: glycosyltransferase family 4 protein [Eubacterium sp.]|nr:glycosyltransferase family 4 protein [Eubacterium sp.]